MDEDFSPSNEGKRRSWHIRGCCVSGCTSKGYRLLIEGERVQYFPFPQFDADICARWANSLKLPMSSITDKTFVCSKHFKPQDYRAYASGDKKHLRRTAIPSFEAVVGLNKPGFPVKKKRKMSDSETTTDVGSGESDEEPQQKIAAKPQPFGISKNVASTTLIEKKTVDGKKISVVMVNNPLDGGIPATVAKTEEKPEVLANAKKVPVLVSDLMEQGPPYPWRKQGLETWASERLEAHEAQFYKITEAINEEALKITQLQEQIEMRREVLALTVIKKTSGRMVLSQYLRQLS